MMKKITLLLSVFLMTLIISCSKSDGHDTSRTLSAKINGTQKYFDNIVVTQVVEADYTDYIITAKQIDDSTKVINISMEKGVAGSESIYVIQYISNDEDYYEASFPNLTTNITENSSSKISGVFSGNLDDGNGTIIQVAQGIININL